jgi:hypothetical protein
VKVMEELLMEEKVAKRTFAKREGTRVVEKKDFF